MLNMKHCLLLALIALSGCAKVQDKPIVDITSADNWHVTVSTRQIPLQVGSNSFVVAIQSPDRAWVKPGDVTLKMTMKAKSDDPAAAPAEVNLQPDGENGHFLALVDLSKADEWQSHLIINHKTVDHRLDFTLANR